MALLFSGAVWGGPALAPKGGSFQDEALVGYLSRDRIVALAASRSGSVPGPSPAALASLTALIDPVHVRVFLMTSRPQDLRSAAGIALAVEVARSSALTAEFVGVSSDLREPAAPLAESGVTETPLVIVYWLGAEVVRFRPSPEGPAGDELAVFIRQARNDVAQEMLLDQDFFRNVFHSDLALDCTRCHVF